MTEKQTIEYLKNCLNDEYNFKNATRKKDKECYEIILNIIQKQDTEINKLKNVIDDIIACAIVDNRKALKSFCDNVVKKTDEECNKQNLLCDDCVKQFFIKKHEKPEQN